MSFRAQTIYNILVVDDDDLTRTMYAERIEKEEEFQVIHARDGQEAWERIQSGGCDLVFTGINMPRMDGFELIRKLKDNSHYASIPIFVSSHMGRPEDKELALSLSVQRFITRGKHTPNEVVMMIRSEVLGKKLVYRLTISPSSPDYDIFIRDFFGSDCPHCPSQQQLPIQLLCDSDDGVELFRFNKDCERCKLPD